VQISSAIARAQLKTLWEDSQEQGLTLADSLKAWRRGRVSVTSEGVVLVGSAGEGVSANFQVIPGLPQSGLAEMADRLENTYDQAKAYLVAGGTTNPTDHSIKDEMLGLMHSARSFTGDYSALRLR
jgi:hypothetical protein